MKITFSQLRKALHESMLLEYVKHMPGHKNSKGESAPWCIVSHETGKVISSHKSKADAKKHLQHMHMFESNGSYEYSFKCSEESTGDYLQEIVHFDTMADNEYLIQDEYLDDGTIRILSEKEFNEMTGNFDMSEICEYPIDFYAMNTSMNILFAYCSENDIHYFFE